MRNNIVWGATLVQKHAYVMIMQDTIGTVQKHVNWLCDKGVPRR